MAIPVFAKTVPEANVLTPLAEIPTSCLYATGSLNVVNTDRGVGPVPEVLVPAIIKIGFGSGASMTLVDTIDDGTVIPPKGGKLILSCALIKPGDKIWVMSDRPGVVFNFTALCQELVVTGV